MQNLVFHNIDLAPVRRDNALWIRDFQIGSALNYANPSAFISRIYNKHADEFTPSMTRMARIHTAGGYQQARVFSLRGTHLLAMFSRTPVAAEFRRWVLDVLDRDLIAGEQKNTTPTLYDFQHVAELEEALLEARPDWRAILRYLDLGLNHVEIARILLVSKDTVRRRIKKMITCGLIPYKPAPVLAALAQKGWRAQREKVRARAAAVLPQLTPEG